WKGLKYHIVIAWTFSKRQYCSFNYIQDNVHVYSFSPDQLQTTINDLIEEAPIHQRHMEKVDKISKPWKRFLEKNMSASLSLLRVYYMREELVGRNTRLAVLFLKSWQHIAMKGKHHLSNNSLEIICAHLFEQLKMTRQQNNAPILAFDIIQEFFKLIIESEKEKKLMVIEWPYRANPFECLVDSKELLFWITSSYVKKKGGNGVKKKKNFNVMYVHMTGNMERKFKHWKDLYD
ncbi:hypothetical protein RFI_33144, partial [Reticulomyxa filosa]